MFERLCIPAGDPLKETAADAIPLNAVDCNVTEEESTACIEKAARDAQARGETIHRWWFEDRKYKAGHQISRAGMLHGTEQNDPPSVDDRKARQKRIVEHVEYCARELQSKARI